MIAVTHDWWEKGAVTWRAASSRRCCSRCRSNSSIISFSIFLLASSTLFATSCSISSFLFSNSSSTRFFTNNSILFAASSSTTCNIFQIHYIGCNYNTYYNFELLGITQIDKTYFIFFTQHKTKFVPAVWSFKLHNGF